MDNLFSQLITYENIRFEDDPAAELPLMLVLKRIKENGYENKRILFHCQGGMSRSPAIVIGYLMATQKYHYTFTQAYDLVAKKRGKLGINPGFIAQLKEFESSISN